MTSLNRALAELGVYSSKAISQEAKSTGNILNLSIGEPNFGPPEHVLPILAENISLDVLVRSTKRYEESRGDIALRRSIARWYQTRYNLLVDPDTEILVTHGGAEALSLAILLSSEPGDFIVTTDPSYMLYRRAISILGRNLYVLPRTPGDEEYAAIVTSQKMLPRGTRAMIVNSPENPTGYMLSMNEWKAMQCLADENDIWVIHDEVYDTMALTRPHFPARVFDPSGERTLIINSFSKKFGVPGLRIGWLLGSETAISAAAKAHDYLNLGVNILSERVANVLLSDSQKEQWFLSVNRMLNTRIHYARQHLTPHGGMQWDRSPMGGMFLFLNVAAIRSELPRSHNDESVSAGEAVAKFLLQESHVAVVPGLVYGSTGADSIRIVLCGPEDVYTEAIERMANLVGNLTAH